MSHVTTIDMEEKYELPELKLMCTNQAWEWREGQKQYGWYGRHVGDFPIPKSFTVEEMGKCDHAIHIPGYDYEIGVVRKSGQWRLIYDFYSAGKLDRVLGKEAGLLKQAYGVARVQTACKRQGYKYSTAQNVADRPGWKKVVVEMESKAAGHTGYQKGQW